MRTGPCPRRSMRGVLAGKQRREIRLGGEIQINGVRAVVTFQQPRSDPAGAAGGLEHDGVGVRVSAAPELQQSLLQSVEVTRAQQRFRQVQHIVCIGQRAQRQRLAQRQHTAALVEQSTEERRADVAGMEDEMQRLALADRLRRLQHTPEAHPAAFDVGREDAVVEETRSPVTCSRSAARAEPHRARDRPSAGRRRAKQRVR